MPNVRSVVAIPDVPLEQVWAVVRDFERYPESMQDVLEVRILECDEREAICFWRVLLNGSELTWTERDTFEPMGRIHFDQIVGDLEVFRGDWILETVDDVVTVTLDVQFDIGVPSLAEILDPIGIQAIKSNSRNMLRAIHTRSVR